MDLSGCKISVLPRGFSSLTNLKYLYLQDNPMLSFGGEAAPIDLSLMTKLIEVNLSNCTLMKPPKLPTTLDNYTGGVSDKTRIDLSNNLLTDISSYYSLPYVSRIITCGNDLEDGDECPGPDMCEDCCDDPLPCPKCPDYEEVPDNMSWVYISVIIIMFIILMYVMFRKRDVFR